MIRIILLSLVLSFGISTQPQNVYAIEVFSKIKNALGIKTKAPQTSPSSSSSSPMTSADAEAQKSPGGQVPISGKKIYNVLALDGGGIRGIGTATILGVLEMKTGKRIYELFDMFIGTSTGGLIAIMLSDGQSATKILDFYVDMGPLIFQKTVSKRLRSVGGLIGTKYTTKQLEKVIADNTSKGEADQKIAMAKRPVGVTAYNVSKGEQKVISSWDTSGTSSKFTLKDAARATSAAPTYFKGREVDGDLWIDGGVGANDPATSAYLEAKAFFPKGAKIRIVSIGTGTANEPPLPRDSSLLNVRTIISTLMQAGAEASQRAMLEKLVKQDSNVEYIRIQYILPSSIDLADTRKKATEVLMKAAFDRTNQSDFIDLKNKLVQGE